MKRKMIGLALIGIGATFTAPAFASNNYVEMHIETSLLSTALNRQLNNNTSFCPYNLPCPTNPNSTCVVDHFDAQTPGTFSRQAYASSISINQFQNIAASKILFTQSVSFAVKTLACVNSPSCGSNGTVYDATLSYELYMNSSAELCIQSASALGVPAGISIPEVDLCLGVGAANISAMTGFGGTSISGFGVSMDPGATRIAVRVEFDKTPAQYTNAHVSAWTSFMQGAITTHGAAENWSLFIHKSLMMSAFKARLASSLNAISGASLTSPVTVFWSPSFMPIAMSGFAEVEMTNTPCPNDIDVEVFSEIGVQKNAASDGVVLNGTFDYDVSTGDAIVCGLAFGGPIGGVILAAVASNIDVSLPGLSNGCTATGSLSFACQQQTHPQTLGLGPGTSAVAHLAGVIRSSLGITMNGPLSLPYAGTPQLTVTTVTPKFGVSGGCNSMKCGTQGALILTGNAKICSVEFSNDPSNIFLITPPASLAPPTAYEIRADPTLTNAQKQTYNNNPTLLYATVRSSAGAKTYAFNAVDLPDDQTEHFKCEATKIMLWAKHCLFPKVKPWEEYLLRFDPDIFMDELLDHALIIETRRGDFVDYGYATNFVIRVERDRNGLVTDVIVHGDAYYGDVNRTPQAMSIEIPIVVPAGTDLMDNVELVADLLPRGLSTFVALPSTRGPGKLSGAGFDLNLSPAQLEVAAEAGR